MAAHKTPKLLSVSGFGRIDAYKESDPIVEFKGYDDELVVDFDDFSSLSLRDSLDRAGKHLPIVVIIIVGRSRC